MMDSITRGKLIKQRGVIKGKLTRALNYVNSFSVNDNLANLHARQAKLRDIWDQYDEVQLRLETEDEEDHGADREEFEHIYFEVEGNIVSIMNSQPIVKHDSSIKSERSSHSIHSETPDINNIKLPRISLPSSNGELGSWNQFRDTFESLVVNNQLLSEVQKFHYLISVLKGQPKELIQNLPVTSANFKVAYEIICERYNNKRLIAMQHVRALLTLPSAHKNSESEIRHLINQVVSNKNALEAMDLPIPLEDLLISQMIMERLDKYTKMEFESRFDNQGFPSLDDLKQFLEGKCQTLQLVQGENQKSCETEDRFKHNKSYKNFKQSYVNTITACVVCKGSHALFRCDEFISMNVQRRIGIIKQHKLCNNCLRGNHHAMECKSKRSCFKCNRHHHTLLHMRSHTTPSHHESIQNRQGTIKIKKPLRQYGLS